jgi:hypothetical protein
MLDALLAVWQARKKMKNSIDAIYYHGSITAVIDPNNEPNQDSSPGRSSVKNHADSLGSGRGDCG